tara:strand:- start:221 stop:739 length:519 start_codon:yes stop_codon:yes gene_type:complete
VKIVITGAPGSGKTSIINSLKKRGFNCFDEISREVIINQIKMGGDALPWKNLFSFSQKVFKLRESQFSESITTIQFFDRSIVDVYAYMKADNLKVPQKFISSIKKNKYHKVVFITPAWKEIYKNDSERQESFTQAIKIEKYLKHSYEKFGYQLLTIPKISVTDRVNFILSKI